MTVRDAIARARLYLVAPFELAAGELPDLVPRLARGGVDLVQLREKDLSARELYPLALRLREITAGRALLVV
ncbi:MAG: thiamine phosphate synthase, partial [Actinomycetota bacterium]|nr:thiamine phosphate synthase [Actinomycetota bacterium]